MTDLIVVVAVVAGPLWLVLTLLNARDRRHDRAAGAVLALCRTPSLRGAVAFQVRARWWSRRIVAVLDLSACDTADVWPAVRRLASVLPPDITLVITVPEPCRMLRVDVLTTTARPGPAAIRRPRQA